MEEDITMSTEGEDSESSNKGEEMEIKELDLSMPL